MNTDAKIEPEAFVNQSGKTDQSVAPAKKKGVGAKPKAAHAAQTAKAPQRPPRSSRAASSTEKLVCRYCGSDDLAPSFKKRRYARCRACFKKRYGSAPQDTRRLPALRKRSPRNSSDRAMNRIGVPERASMSNPSSSARVESISRAFFICLRIPKIRVERLPHPFIFTHISSWQLCLLKATRGLADFSVRVRAKSGTNPHARWHMPTIVRRRRVGFSDGRSFL